MVQSLLPLNPMFDLVMLFLLDITTFAAKAVIVVFAASWFVSLAMRALVDAAKEPAPWCGCRE
jgi:hypothetical protein